jgi:hypothetical protein
MKMPFPHFGLFLLAGILAIPAVGNAETVRISRTDCQRLIEHKARSDVAYQPGIDVRGKQVVPAQGPGTPDMGALVPEMLEFSIALNPLKGGAARFGETSLGVGMIQFDMKKRQAMLDGVPLTRGDTQALLDECRRTAGKAK